MEFKNYTHFKNYCLKIALNKDYIASEQEKSIFNKFEELINLLNELESSSILKINKSIYDIVCLYFKCEKFSAIFKHMNYFINKLSKFFNNEVSFYYVVTSLNTIFDLEIEFKEDFILNGSSKSSIFYPSKISVLELKDVQEKIYTISEYDANYKNKFGVYFIYDSDGAIAYIGKSSTCVLSRCLQSARERKTLDFSKIELRECKNKSDVAIYEAYYISLYKPRYNSDLMFDDFPTIRLPELEISKVISRNVESEYFICNYTYYRQCVMNSDEFLSLLHTKKVYLNIQKNIDILQEIGIHTKYDMHNKAYALCLDDIKSEGKYATSELA